MSAKTVVNMLRSVGVESISYRTHIQPAHVRALLNEEFETFTPVQFSGFVTILEREYDIDLSEWRQQYAQSVPDQPPPLTEHGDDPFVNAARSDRRQRRTMYTLVVFLIVIIVAMVRILDWEAPEKKLEINNTAIEKAKENMAMKSVAASEANGTMAQAVAIQDARHASTVSETNVTEEVKVEYEDIIIRPRTKVWLGVIDADTHKRDTRTTSEPWRLDGSREWLIITGHGLLSLECGGINASYAERDRLLFLYEDGRCRQIDEAEFRARNRGRVW